MASVNECRKNSIESIAEDVRVWSVDLSLSLRLHAVSSMSRRSADSRQRGRSIGKAHDVIMPVLYQRCVRCERRAQASEVGAFTADR